MRLDQYLATYKDVKSRAAAQDLIKEGYVEVNKKIIRKPAYTINDTDCIVVHKSEHEFASRGGLKLFYAIEKYHVQLSDKVVLDIGASTGGFTDVCLQQGARHVYAVDVGVDQLAQSLKDNPKVSNLESCDIRTLDPAKIQQVIDFICIDVSFISLKKIFDVVVTYCNDKTELLVLVKPQFEVGKNFVNKQGVVKDKNVHKRLLLDYMDYFQSLGFGIKAIDKAAIQGRSGNQEYIFYMKYHSVSKSIHIQDVLKGE
ncbi:23S rRNA (cytidine1920-2'-O)/16S rRNA (cytidine1409-2'-O)-methyltransferase [Breznakia blatticola]|uniref:23S rRNA (Cytidine1920-2'-O)/16S rRNA (Cytidine1409-2'-O)-methyltransferase n=1 Tax=Breznakia blatticola TaxID=1754012 RepID=A0A4V3G6C9_9FIRM|nr:TlyA family RNA methyltransferase [Breznakia blatticola]TDW14814.1 23S rRNA (cytidine1920-2'-O)/16S rRNA (cytidine1409-2'-O)-methyltransferase [Breznakia blatticola]